MDTDHLKNQTEEIALYLLENMIHVTESYKYQFLT